MVTVLQTKLYTTSSQPETQGGGSNFARRGHGAASGDIFGCHDWEGATGTSWGEVRKDRPTHGTAPSPPKNDLAQDIHGGGMEKV